MSATTETTPLRSRLRLLAWTPLLLVLSLPACLPLLLLTVVSLPLVFVSVGLPLFAAVVWATRQHADLHRRFFTSLGVTVARPYRPRAAGHVGQRLAGVARDRATWRDVGWLVLDGTVGTATYLLVTVLAGGVLWHLSYPLLWRLLPDPAPILRTDYGIVVIDGPEAAWLGIPIALLFLGLWWWLVPQFLRGFGRLARMVLAPTGRQVLAARVDELAASRADAVDARSAELRRIERDLHDGAQARLVSLGMNLGMAEELVRTDPEAAAQLLAEARDESGRALGELRELVRGIHPPVLSDRGLSGAVHALALAHPLPIEVVDQLTTRLPDPVESAAYFALAETLTNIAKHAGASSVTIGLRAASDVLIVTVEDDGRGGAELVPGGGLDGIGRRLAAFDGSVEVTSPPGGPTVVNLEVPCVW